MTRFQPFTFLEPLVNWETKKREDTWQSPSKKIHDYNGGLKEAKGTDKVLREGVTEFTSLTSYRMK